jgi:hypothetical protein
MTIKIVTIQLALDVDNEAEAADAVNEILRDQQRVFSESSCLIDYVQCEYSETSLSAENYDEGDAFTTPIHGAEMVQSGYQV